MITLKIDKSQRCKRSEYSVFVSFDFDMDIVNILRAYPTRYYNENTKEWEIPIRDLDYLKNDFKAYRTTIIDERVNTHENEKQRSNTLKTRSNKTSQNMLDDYAFKTNPFQHQTEGVMFGLEHNKWLLGDEQGLGKTKQAIDLALINKNELGYKHCLIICGVNGLKWNWQSEIKTHSNEYGWILGQRMSKGKLVVRGNKEKLDDLMKIDELPFFIITNVESLRDKNILNELVRLCKNKTINMCVADECHKMKNPQSQQGKAFLKIDTDYKLALTGTPLMNTPLDLYIILKWLDYEDHTFYTFKNHYCIMGGFGGYEIVGYKNMRDIQDILDKMMLRRLKQDVLDLPEKIFVDEYVEMSPKQEQIYREVNNQIRAEIDQIALSPNPLANLIRLRQATGYTGILSSTIQESAKLDRLEEIVDDAVANEKKVVIFSNWTQVTDAVQERLSKKYRGVVITGETNDALRQINVNEFQTNDKCKYILGTIGAMGTGLTLTAGTIEIFMDEPWNRALLDQAVDRCHRVGTTENITIYTLMCKNTIDERIHEIVERKGLMSDAIIDGKIAINKRELLNFLLN